MLDYRMHCWERIGCRMTDREVHGRYGELFLNVYLQFSASDIAQSRRRRQEKQYLLVTSVF